MSTVNIGGPGPGMAGLVWAIWMFLFGLCFGMGFCIAAAVLHFIGSFLVGAHQPGPVVLTETILRLIG